MTKKTQPSLRLTEETLDSLRVIKKATRLPMSTILEGIVLDHMDLHHKRYLDVVKKQKMRKKMQTIIEKEVRAISETFNKAEDKVNE